MTSLTEQLARRMIVLANGRNVDQSVEHYSADATFQFPSMDQPLRGRDAIHGFMAGSLTAFPDWTVDVSKVFVSGDESAFVNSIHGTHRGPLIGANGRSIAPTRKKFVHEQMTRVVFDREGMIQSLRAYGNPLELHRQLGIKP